MRLEVHLALGMGAGASSPKAERRGEAGTPKAERRVSGGTASNKSDASTPRGATPRSLEGSFHESFRKARGAGAQGRDGQGKRLSTEEALQVAVKGCTGCGIWTESRAPATRAAAPAEQPRSLVPLGLPRYNSCRESSPLGPTHSSILASRPEPKVSLG